MDVNKIKTIGIDLDSVLNNLHEEWLRRYNEDYNDNLTPKDIKSFDIHKYVKCGMQIHKYLNEVGFFRNLKPMPHAQEITKKLIRYYDVYVVTATSPNNALEKSLWLREHFPHLNIDKLILSKDKSIINIDLLIDDAVHNIINFPNQALVFDHAWNRNISGYERVYNWQQIGDLLL